MPPVAIYKAARKAPQAFKQRREIGQQVKKLFKMPSPQVDKKHFESKIRTPIFSAIEKMPTFKAPAGAKAMIPLLNAPDAVKGVSRTMARIFLGEPGQWAKPLEELSKKEQIAFGTDVGIGVAGAAPRPLSRMTPKVASQILKVKETATPAQVNKAWKNLLKKELPRTLDDIAKSYNVNSARLVNKAKEVLMRKSAGIKTTPLLSPTGKGGTVQAQKTTSLPKKTPEQRLKHLITYEDDLAKKGFTSKERARIGFQRAGDILEQKGRSRHFGPEDIKEVSKSLDAADDPKTPTPVGEKVGILDLLRTPDRVLRKIGLAPEAGYLRTRYEKYLDDLPVEINKITEWSKRVDKSRKVDLFRYLDGRKSEMSAELSKQELEVAKEIQAYLRGWAKKLDLPADKTVTHYITHIFESDLIKKEFDEDLARLITDKVPGSVYDPFLEQRMGEKGYIEDPWRALDAYVKRATRKVNMDPALKRLRDKVQITSKVVDEHGVERTLTESKIELSQYNYVKNLTERINLRPTNIDNMIDNTVKQMFGYRFGARPTANITKKWRRLIYRGTLGLNVSSSLKNLTQGVNTYAKLGEKYTTIGYIKAMKDFFLRSGELEKSGVLRDTFIQDRQISAVKQLGEKMDKGLYLFFDSAERINRGAAYYGAKAKALAKGASEADAIQAGKDLSAVTQFIFGPIDTPPVLQADINKLLLQFQSFAIKQTEFVAEMAKNKEWGGMFRWIGANLVLMAVIGDALGLDLGDIVPPVNILRGDTKLGQTPSTQLIGGGVKMLFGDEKRREEGAYQLKKTIVTHIPAGVQAKKTLSGMKATEEGGMFTSADKLKFPVSQESGDAIFNAVFGPYRGEGAAFYFDNELTALGARDTILWKDAVSKGGDPYAVWVKIYKNRIAEGIITKTKKILKDPKLSVKEKRKESQAVIDEAKQLMKRLNEFGGVRNEPLETDKPQSGTGTSEKITSRVRVKKGKKPTLAKRTIRIKRASRLKRKTPTPIVIAKVKEMPERSFKYA